MAYVIKDSKTKPGLIFNPLKKRRFKTEEEHSGEPEDAPDPNQEEEDENIPEETGQHGSQGPDEAQGSGDVEEEIQEEEEDDDSEWIEGAECIPDMDHQCGPGMYCSFETSTCVSDENQEEEQLAYDEEQEQKREEEAAEAKAKADQEAADAKAKAEKEAAAKKKTSKSSTKSGGGGGGGGKYMSKNDKLWKKKLSKKGVVSKVGPATNKGYLKIIGLGLVSLGGYLGYKNYSGLKKKAGKLDKIKSVISDE